MDKSTYKSIPITVIDDEESFCDIINRFLSARGFSVTTFTDADAALEHIKQTHPDIVLTDMRMPSHSGFDILQASLAVNPGAKVIIITGNGDIPDCVKAMELGATNYIEKPWEAKELIKMVECAAQNVHGIRESTRIIKAEAIGLSGQSAVIEAVRERIRKVAPTDMTILITGESGTGKEVAAHALYELSKRKGHAFVAINCAGIPANLLESELFGYEKGAFTGAVATKKGLFEVADKGTLFLDEIGEMPYDLQAKMLRVLQDFKIQRVGGLSSIKVDLRIIAATNKDLKAEVRANRFRDDLYQRLNVIPINMPPLRHRPEDIELLAQIFLRKAAVDIGKGEDDLRISDEAMAFLKAYEFPGNVRKLQSMIMRAVALCTGNVIEICDLNDNPSDITLQAISVAQLEGKKTKEKQDDSTLSGDSSISSDINFKQARESWEHKFFTRVIQKAQGNMTRAAEIAGISRRNLYEKLERLGIKTRDENKDDDE